MGGSASSAKESNESVTKDSIVSINSPSINSPPAVANPLSSDNTNTNAFAALDFPLRRSTSEVFVEDTVSENKVVIFSKTSCPSCTTAKSVFESLGVAYKTVELNQRPDCADLQDHLKQVSPGCHYQVSEAI